MAGQAVGGRRLFFALWPPGAVQRDLAGRARRLLGDRGRPVPTRNIHLTLAFAGEVSEDAEACLREQAGAVTVPPFTLRLDCLGHWRRKALLWAAPGEPPDALLRLGRGLAAALPACGLPAPRRDFTPHVTLSRKAPPPSGGEGLADPPQWTVARFALVASRLSHHGAEYATVAEWPLTHEDSAGEELL